MTRRRIIETAGRRLKRDGIDGSGVATLMKDAGLTNGAFYAHFESKEDLVAAAVADQFCEQRERLAAVAPGRAGLEQVVRTYLSPEHRDNPEEGCPSAALLDEISRCADSTKQAYTDSVLAFIDDMAARLAPHDPRSARTKTLSAYALMIGTLQLSRALADPQLADDLLEQGIRNALAVLTSRNRTERPRHPETPAGLLDVPTDSGAAITTLDRGTPVAEFTSPAPSPTSVICPITGPTLFPQLIIVFFAD